jgi:hypothetical protein
MDNFKTAENKFCFFSWFIRRCFFLLLSFILFLSIFSLSCDKIAVEGNNKDQTTTKPVCPVVLPENKSEQSTFPSCPTVYYKDFDGDKFSDGITSCEQKPGFYRADELCSTYGDCNDDNKDVYPGSTTFPEGVTQVCPPPATSI